MTTTPTPAPLAHGHASDADALLLIVALYTARAVEALGAYYRATAAAQDNAKALNAAQIFEIDDVIDPAETRGLIAATLAAAGARGELPPLRRFVDTW